MLAVDIVRSAAPDEPVPASRRGLGVGPLLVLIKGVLIGVGGVYLATGSVVVTLIAGAVAIAVAALGSGGDE